MSLRRYPTGQRRLRKLELLLEELAQRSSTCPVVVEGMRDRDALRALGVEGRIIRIHRGRSLPDLASALSRTFREVILLSDWDRKGKELFSRLSALLSSEGLKVDESVWRAMHGLVAKEVQAVEDLPSLMQQLRDELG